MQPRGRMTLWALTAVAVAVMLTGAMAWAQSASADGPYFVVDQSVGANTTHVFGTINAALNRLNNLGPQAWGATLVLLPGSYPVAAKIDINIPYLKIVTRDGADKARLVGNLGGANPMINIQARGVMLQGVKLVNSTGAATMGIQITAPDVSVRGVLISGFPLGINAQNADRMSVIGCSVTNNNGAGIQLTNCPDAVITECDVRSNNAAGVNIVTSNNVRISSSRISNNTGNGITINRSSYVEITENKEIRANGASGIAITDSGHCDVSGNTLIANPTGITLATSVGCTVQENTCENSTGPAISLTDSTGNLIIKNRLYGVENPNPAAATILLAGNATGNTVSENEMTANTWGIVLNVAGGLTPSGNRISGNEISKTSRAGIYVRRSGGNNVIEKNSVSDSVEFGLLIEEGNGDRFANNSIERSASAGINITNTQGPVENCLLTNNLVADCGGNGITVTTPTAGNDITDLVLSFNTIDNAAGSGLSVTDMALACQRLSVKFNKVAGNEDDGVSITGTTNTSLWRNVIHDNEGVGLRIASLNGDASVRRNTIYANQRGGVNYTDNGTQFVLEENSIFLNLGYALSVSGKPLLGGTSFAKNWWGSATGPAGVYSGVGNAVLGVGNGQRIEPILPAPPFMGLADDAKLNLTLANAQVSFIPSFTAGRVVVDRTDTAGIKLTFTEVSVRNNAFVATIPFAGNALSSGVFTNPGKVIAASCVLVSGIQDGTVSVSFEYPANLSAEGDRLSLYVYQGGNWELDKSGTWTLGNGRWVPVSNCHLGDANSVIGDIPVESLTGAIKAIALVEEQTP